MTEHDGIHAAGGGEQPRKDMGWWAHLATVLGVPVAAVALIAGMCTYKGSADLQRALSARDTYREHVELSLQNPALARGHVDLNQPDSATKYGWFVGHAFHSAEGILEADPGNDGWEATIKSMVLDHWRWVCGPDFPREHYGPPFLKLASEAVHDSSRACSNTLAIRARAND